jgi:hypothetical protein
MVTIRMNKLSLEPRTQTNIEKLGVHKAVFLALCIAHGNMDPKDHPPKKLLDLKSIASLAKALEENGFVRHELDRTFAFGSLYSAIYHEIAPNLPRQPWDLLSSVSHLRNEQDYRMAVERYENLHSISEEKYHGAMDEISNASAPYIATIIRFRYGLRDGKKYTTEEILQRLGKTTFTAIYLEEALSGEAVLNDLRRRSVLRRLAGEDPIVSYGYSECIKLDASVPIRNLFISIPTRDRLLEAGFTTVGDVRGKTEGELRRIVPGILIREAREIVRFLDAFDE